MLMLVATAVFVPVGRAPMNNESTLASLIDTLATRTTPLASNDKMVRTHALPMAPRTPSTTMLAMSTPRISRRSGVLFTRVVEFVICTSLKTAAAVFTDKNVSRSVALRSATLRIVTVPMFVDDGAKVNKSVLNVASAIVTFSISAVPKSPE